MSTPDTEVGTIDIIISLKEARMRLSTDLMADVKIVGDTPAELQAVIDSDSLRYEVAGHLSTLAKLIADNDSPLSAMFDMEMR